jgi:hypothetical protein
MVVIETAAGLHEPLKARLCCQSPFTPSDLVQAPEGQRLNAVRNEGVDPP